MQVNDKIDQLNVTAKMESIEAKVTDLVEEKINEAVRKTRNSGRKLCQRSQYSRGQQKSDYVTTPKRAQHKSFPQH